MPIPTRGFPQDYSDDFLDHNSRNKPPFKPEDFQPEKSIEKEPTPETLPEKPPRFTVQGVLFFLLVVAGLLVLGQFILPLFPEEYIEILIYAYLYFAMGFDPTKWFGRLFKKKK